MKKIIIYFSLTILFSCTNSITNQVIKPSNNHLKMYSFGDKVIYQSSDNSFDTLTIMFVDSKLRSINKSKKQRLTGIINFQNENIKNDWFIVEFQKPKDWKGFLITCQDSTPPSGYEIDYKKLIELSNIKTEPTDLVFVNFKNFWPTIETDSGEVALTILGNLHKDTLIVNSRKIYNYYIIKEYYQTTKPHITNYYDEHNNIEKIIWTDEEGLIAYKTKNNIWWTKK